MQGNVNFLSSGVSLHFRNTKNSLKQKLLPLRPRKEWRCTLQVISLTEVLKEIFHYPWLQRFSVFKRFTYSKYT